MNNSLFSSQNLEKNSEKHVDSELQTFRKPSKSIENSSFQGPKALWHHLLLGIQGSPAALIFMSLEQSPSRCVRSSLKESKISKFDVSDTISSPFWTRFHPFFIIFHHISPVFQCFSMFFHLFFISFPLFFQACGLVGPHAVPACPAARSVARAVEEHPDRPNDEPLCTFERWRSLFGASRLYMTRISIL